MKRNGGFTLTEMIMGMAILALLMAVAIPTLIQWRPNMQLRQWSNELMGNMQKAKMHAIKNNLDVILTFTPAGTCPGGSYSFVDSSGVTVVEVTMDDFGCLSSSTFPANEGFTPKGFPVLNTGGTVTITHSQLTDSGDTTYTITQTVAGNLQLQRVALP